MGLYSDDEDDSEHAEQSKIEDNDEPETKRSRRDEIQPSSSSSVVDDALPELLAAFTSGCAARKGERDEMQDTHLMVDDLLEMEVKRKDGNSPGPRDLVRCSLYAVFDGHAGARAAQYCEQKMATDLRQRLAAFTELKALESSLSQLFTQSYRTIDQGFLNDAKLNRPPWKDGATATTLLVVNNAIYAANVGDTRAVVARSKPSGDDGSEERLAALQLTLDHSPLQYDERMRIQKAGGHVKDGRVMGVIEVSRSIGDGPYKALGVSCQPVVKKLTITADDKFVLLACDGLWKAFSNQAAVDEAARLLTVADKEEKGVVLPLGERRAAVCEWVAGKLATEAVRLGSGDNVSVVLVLLEPGLVHPAGV